MADNKKSSISRRSSCYLLNLKQPDKTARRLKLSFQRTAASVKILKAERQVEASVGFLDVSETGAGIFTPELLHKGSHVELTITEPAQLQVRGIVAWSIPVTSGIHDGKFRCRSGIQFVLEGESQTQAVQEFVKKAGQDPIENFRSAMNAQAAVAATAPATPAPADATPSGTAAGIVEVPFPGTPEALAAAAAAAPPADAPVPAEPSVVPPMAAEPAPGPVAEAPAAEAPPAADAVAPTGGSGEPEGGQQAA